MDFFYRKNPWYAGQFVRKITSKIKIPPKATLYFSAILGKQKQNLLSVLVRNVDKKFSDTTIQLPTKNKQPDYKAMETFISSIQKLVIKDVVEYADKKIEASKTVVNK